MYIDLGQQCQHNRNSISFHCSWAMSTDSVKAEPRTSISQETGSRSGWTTLSASAQANHSQRRGLGVGWVGIQIAKTDLIITVINQAKAEVS